MPELETATWIPARLPLPDGSVHLALDPNADVAAGDDEMHVTIPRFSIAHDAFQAADSAKYVAFSEREYELPQDGPATFAMDMAVRNIGGDPADYRRGMAAFHVFDLATTTRVFAVCGTSTRALALHEQLAGEGAFYHVAESPYAEFGDDLTRPRACEVTLDRGAATATWAVDGQTIYAAHGTVIPERVRVGLGIWTMLPIRDGRSRSLSDQGLEARWRGLRISGAEA
jgi:hypothetical protein